MNTALPLAISVILFGSISHSPAQDAAQAAGIASAREAARIQFERDLGAAEIELAVADKNFKSATQFSDQVIARATRGERFSSEALQRVLDDLRSATLAYQTTKNRRDFLILEAARLNIPISPDRPYASAEKEAVRAPTQPVRNRANDKIVLNAVDH